MSVVVVCWEKYHPAAFMVVSLYQEHVAPVAKGTLRRSGSSESFGSTLSLYGVKGDYAITGEVLFGVHYHEGRLLVNVERAKGLAATDKGGFSNPYIKTYLLPDKSQHSKRKTDTKKKTLDPVYDQILKVS